MKKPVSKSKTLDGVIVYLNVSPEGLYEGIMLQLDKKTVQINFPDHAGFDAGKELKIGKKLSIEATPFDDEGYSGHSVYVWNNYGLKSVEGIVKSINYSLHGEPNGALLDNKIFVHAGPHGAKAAKLSVGQKIHVEGEEAKSDIGITVIEAHTINGITL
jgi:hypothetical protein